MSDAVSDCLHLNLTIPRARGVSNGIQYRRQCLDCGKAIGNAVSKAIALQEANGRPEAFDEELLAQGVQAAISAHVHNLELKSEEWFSWYNLYLRSQEWHQRRRLVLERCCGVCEGCRSDRVVEVHHLTYDHVGRELLFELVGLCGPCHRIAHEANPTAMPMEARVLEMERKAANERGDINTS